MLFPYIWFLTGGVKFPKIESSDSKVLECFVYVSSMNCMVGFRYYIHFWVNFYIWFKKNVTVSFCCMWLSNFSNIMHWRDLPVFPVHLSLLYIYYFNPIIQFIRNRCPYIHILQMRKLSLTMLGGLLKVTGKLYTGILINWWVCPTKHHSSPLFPDKIWRQK